MNTAWKRSWRECSGVRRSGVNPRPARWLSGNRMEERPRGGGAECLPTGWRANPRQDAHCVHVRVLALRRPHADGGVALEQLDAVEAFLHRVDEVLELQVLVEVDEVLALRMLDDGIGVGGHRVSARSGGSALSARSPRCRSRQVRCALAVLRPIGDGRRPR